jgi:hypothetical protein
MKRIGYFVETYGGGRYGSVAFYGNRAEAEAEVARIMMLGAWSGMPPRVTETDCRTIWEREREWREAAERG